MTTTDTETDPAVNTAANPAARAAALDTGTAYERPPGSHRARLTEVGPGTPMGELMRRYWHPVGLASDAGTLPRAVRVLGEDLILFRDQQGRPGLLHPRCVHRGSSLLYGRVEPEGLRCCYHGWAFDVQGRCYDQPCEPNNGMHRDKVRQPWYPVQDHYGLVWAYMGPPEKKPLLPRYDVLEDLAPGEQLFTDDRNIGAGTRGNGPVPFNWLQHYENIHDAGHFLWLHFFHSGPQFGSRYGEFDKLDFQPWQWLEGGIWRQTATGIAGERTKPIPDGRTLHSVVETVLPCVRGVANPWGKPGRIDQLGFVLPVDDTHFRIYTVLRGETDAFFQMITKLQVQKEAQVAADPLYTQKYPNDFEAQGSQGAITLHSEEHLASSDRGIVMLRRLFEKQLDIVAAGGDPINVAFEPGHALLRLEAGQFLSEG